MSIRKRIRNMLRIIMNPLIIINNNNYNNNDMIMGRGKGNLRG